MKVLKSINAEDLKDESDKAYYKLLTTQAQLVLYQRPIPDSTLNECIKFYTKHYDAEKLAKAYYYNGAILSKVRKIKKCDKTLKSRRGARKKSQKVLILIHHIEEQLSIVNAKTGNFNTL